MTLDGVCLEQQEIITRQNAIISALLQELALHRALDAEEKALMDNSAPVCEILREGDAKQ